MARLQHVAYYSNAEDAKQVFEPRSHAVSTGEVVCPILLRLTSHFEFCRAKSIICFDRHPSASERMSSLNLEPTSHRRSETHLRRLPSGSLDHRLTRSVSERCAIDAAPGDVAMPSRQICQHGQAVRWWPTGRAHSFQDPRSASGLT